MIGGIEEAAGIASAPALTAVMAGRPPVMIAGQHGPPPGDDRNPHARRCFPQQHLAAAGRRCGHMILAAREDLGIVVAAAHADELVHLVIVWSQVLVRDRPTDSDAVALRRLEVQV